MWWRRVSNHRQYRYLGPLYLPSRFNSLKYMKLITPSVHDVSRSYYRWRRISVGTYYHRGELIFNRITQRRLVILFRFHYLPTFPIRVLIRRIQTMKTKLRRETTQVISFDVQPLRVYRSLISINVSFVLFLQESVWRTLMKRHLQLGRNQLGSLLYVRTDCVISVRTLSWTSSSRWVLYGTPYWEFLIHYYLCPRKRWVKHH